jgi:hypothetical protein
VIGIARTTAGLLGVVTLVLLASFPALAETAQPGISTSAELLFAQDSRARQAPKRELRERIRELLGEYPQEAERYGKILLLREARIWEGERGDRIQVGLGKRNAVMVEYRLKF